MNKELLQQALEALESAIDYTDNEAFSPSVTRQCGLAIAALESAIAQPVQPQAVDTSHLDCWQSRDEGHCNPICEPCNTGNRDRCLYKKPTAQPVQPAPQNLQKRLEDLHLYEEIAEHYAKCAVSPEALLTWVTERINSKQAAKKATP